MIDNLKEKLKPEAKIAIEKWSEKFPNRAGYVFSELEKKRDVIDLPYLVVLELGYALEQSNIEYDTGFAWSAFEENTI